MGQKTQRGQKGQMGHRVTRMILDTARMTGSILSVDPVRTECLLGRARIAFALILLGDPRWIAAETLRDYVSALTP